MSIVGKILETGDVVVVHKIEEKSLINLGLTLGTLIIFSIALWTLSKKWA